MANQDTNEVSKRLRIQGDIDEVASAILRTYAYCKGSKSKPSGVAVEILENYLTSPEFIKKLETAMQWASEENLQSAAKDLNILGVSLPKSLQNSNNRDQQP